VVNCLAVRRHMEDDEHNPPSHTLLCYNGIDTRIFCPGESRRPAVLDPAGIAIGVVCGLRPEKTWRRWCGRSTPSGALARTPSSLSWQRPIARRLATFGRDLDVAGACHFEPATSDVTRCCARWTSSFCPPAPRRSRIRSWKPWRAMLPVASDVGGNPELVTPMETGLLFRSGDAADLAAKLELLAGNPACATRWQPGGGQDRNGILSRGRRRAWEKSICRFSHGSFHQTAAHTGCCKLAREAVVETLKPLDRHKLEAC